MIPSTKDAYRLFHQGAVALARVESVGMPLDVAKLQANSEEVQAQIRTIERELRSDPIYKEQQRIYGKDASLGSREQLAEILFGRMGLPGAKRSAKTGKYKLDDEILRGLGIEYGEKYLDMQKLHKIKGTYIDGLLRDCVNGRVHGFINLHNVKSFRGSADSPNLNNLPSRDKKLLRYIKGAICPLAGWYIVESDYSALEVHVAACYHKDPTMIAHLETGYDMHSSVSQQCFIFDDTFAQANKSLAKSLRQATKGDFVFGAMYGNYYLDIALRLWQTATKTGMLEHLASKGIKRLGLEFDPEEGKWVENGGPDAFVTHIKAIEDDFWNNRYAVYGQWRRDWYRAYCQKGYFQSLTGFTWSGVEKRNFIINAPVQGSAFHCLLQSIIDIQREISSKKMRSRIFLEIHDSILALVPAEELHEYVSMSNDIMTTKLRQKWPWICLDLKTEVEVSNVSWADKQEYTGNEA